MSNSQWTQSTNKPDRDVNATERHCEPRVLGDAELESRRRDAERACAELRRELERALAWCLALEAEADRRSVQRRGR